MKIVYAGSPQYAVAPLKALIAAGREIVAVVTQPDRPVGRKRQLTPTPVKSYALSLGIPVIDCPKIREHADEVRALGADLMITCAYGQILSKDILDAFPRGVYNLHASLLPQFRGASPIQSAILAGCEYTGVTVMKTELSLDSGGILLVKRTSAVGKTAGELSEELSALSAVAAVEAVDILESGEENLLIQDEARATYCKKISKADAAIDFASSDGAQVARLINAMSPSPSAYCTLAGNTVNLLKASPCEGAGDAGEVLSADKGGIVIACKSGAVKVTLIQFAGGRAIAAADAVNGRKIKAGDRFD